MQRKTFTHFLLTTSFTALHRLHKVFASKNDQFFFVSPYWSGNMIKCMQNERKTVSYKLRWGKNSRFFRHWTKFFAHFAINTISDSTLIPKSFGFGWRKCRWPWKIALNDAKIQSNFDRSTLNSSESAVWYEKLFALSKLNRKSMGRKLCSL